MAGLNCSPLMTGDEGSFSSLMAPLLPDALCCMTSHWFTVNTFALQINHPKKQCFLLNFLPSWVGCFEVGMSEERLETGTYVGNAS